MRGSLKASVLGMALMGSVALVASSASAATFPGYGNDTNGPGFIININSSGDTVTATGAGPYDGSDDTYVGVINNTNSAVSSVMISSTADIFGFDGDGIDTYGAPGNAVDTTGYGGPNSYFTNIVFGATMETGTVNFIVPLAANGGSTYFSLEEDLTAAGGGITVGNVPLPASFPMFGGALLALGVVAYGAKRRKAGAAAV